MAVTLEWIRDNYDANKDRRIDKSESIAAMNDLIYSGSITKEQFDAVKAAYDNNTLLPSYDTPAPPPTTVTLLWIRDHYDSNKDRHIDKTEATKAMNDLIYSGSITKEQFDAVKLAYDNNTLLPAYDTPAPPPSTITCNGATPHHSSGCALLLYYDADRDGIISSSELDSARRDRDDTRRGIADTLTIEECDFVIAAESAGSINALCPGCYTGTTPPLCTPYEKRCYNNNTVETCKADGTGWTRSNCASGYECKNGVCVKSTTPTPPNMETRTIDLTEGQHSMQVSLSGYNTLNATLNVSSSSVSCSSVTGGSCSTSGWTVTTGLTPTTTTGGRCAWISTQDTSKVAFISEMVLAYLGIKNIGFVPSAAEIGDAVLMYLNLGTPKDLWGC